MASLPSFPIIKLSLLEYQNLKLKEVDKSNKYIQVEKEIQDITAREFCNSQSRIKKSHEEIKKFQTPYPFMRSARRAEKLSKATGTYFRG